jgi:hypothetical protein
MGAVEKLITLTLLPLRSRRAAPDDLPITTDTVGTYTQTALSAQRDGPASWRTARLRLRRSARSH